VSTRPRITVGDRAWYPRSRLHDARAAFRRWRRARPFWGGLWCLLGGALIAYFPAQSFKLLLVTNGSVVIGVAVGVAVAIMGLFLWFLPSQRHVAGVMAVLLSVVSLITSTFGGLLIGLILGTVGGALGFAWTPRERSAPE
jgi:MFS family permease